MDFITLNMLIDSFLKKLGNYEIIQEIKEEHYRDEPFYSRPAVVKKIVKYKIKKMEV